MIGSPPPAPNPDAGPHASAMPGQNALMMPQPRRQMAAPNHRQVVAALRHFMTIVDELQTLEKNPALGRSSIKSEIIDGTMKLVAERMLSAASAVSLLANVPEDPIRQRKWVQETLQQTIQAQNNVLDHHAAGNHGTLDWATESQHAPYNSDDHLSIMEGLAGNYRPSA
jgi:hypothetical protein